MRNFLSFLKRKKNTEGDIVRSCSVCENSSEIKDADNNVLCSKFGVVNRDYSCKKFHYDPLKRIPHKRPYGIADIHELVEDCVIAEGRDLKGDKSDVAVDEASEIINDNATSESEKVIDEEK